MKKVSLLLLFSTSIIMIVDMILGIFYNLKIPTIWISFIYILFIIVPFNISTYVGTIGTINILIAFIISIFFETEINCTYLLLNIILGAILGLLGLFSKETLY